MNTVTKVVAAANAQGRFLNSAELEAIFGQSRKRLAAAEFLTGQAQKLAVDAVGKVCQKFPKYSESSYLKAKCTRDIEYFIRSITYCLIAGNTEPISDYIFPGIDEVYRSLDLPSSCAIEALVYIKEHHELMGDIAIETNAYIDYLINGLPNKLESFVKQPEDFLVSEERLRGVVVIPHQRKLLFKQEFELNSTQLPRWTPHITMDRRMAEANND
jgi:phycocyanin alpha chain